MRGLPTATDLRAEQARRSLRLFIEDNWTLVEPAAPFMAGFHIDAICQVLQAVTDGQITRLVINIPPRHGKSLLVSTLWQPWAWITRPELRWLTASYAEQLAVRDSGRSRRLIESPAYQSQWGHVVRLAEDVNRRGRFENTAGGARIATGVGGAATGEGGDIIIIDDAHKIEEAHSKAAREAAVDWFDATISTRLNDLRTGALVVVGQRLHERDLPGHLIARDGWEHLCLPLEYEPKHPFVWPGDPRRTPGELLWPERYGQKEVAELKERLGSQGSAGQLQQLPAPAGGAIIERPDFRYYNLQGPYPRFEQILTSWDPTFGAGKDSDYVVGQAWGSIGANKYLLRQIRGRMTFSQTIAAIRQLSAWVAATFPEHPAPMILIEKTANGAATIDILHNELPSIVPVTPRGDKISRVQAITPQLQAGNVHVPGAPNHDNTNYDRALTPAWTQHLINEAVTFPSGAYDDQVDAMTQALTQLGQRPPRFTWM